MSEEMCEIPKKDETDAQKSLDDLIKWGVDCRKNLEEIFTMDSTSEYMSDYDVHEQKHALGEAHHDVTLPDPTKGAEGKVFALEGSVDRYAYKKGKKREGTILYKVAESNINFYQGSKDHAFDLLAKWENVKIDFPSLQDGESKERMKTIIQAISELTEFTDAKFEAMVAEKGFTDDEIYGEEGALQVLLAYRRALTSSSSFYRSADAVRTVILKIGKKPGAKAKFRYTKVYEFTPATGKKEAEPTPEPTPEPEKPGEPEAPKEDPNPKPQRETLPNGDYIDERHPNGMVKKGKLTWTDGSIREGEFYENEYLKNGKITKPDGTTWQGEFYENGNFKNGIITWPDGETWRGDFYENGNFRKGKLTYPNGNTYVGEWDENGKLKKGKKTLIDGRIREGDFYENGKLKKGKLTDLSGNTYVGEWDENGNFRKGKLTYPNGNTYVGEWDENGNAKPGNKESFDSKVLEQSFSTKGQKLGFKDLGFWDDEEYDKKEVARYYDNVIEGVEIGARRLISNGIDKRMMALVKIRLIHSESESEGFNHSYGDVITIDYNEPSEARDGADRMLSASISDDIVNGMEDFLENESKEINFRYPVNVFQLPAELNKNASRNWKNGGLECTFQNQTDPNKPFTVRIDRFGLTNITPDSPFAAKFEGDKVIIYKKEQI